jgi:(p)ppGpp synthase/HD superfamily hydrolase
MNHESIYARLVDALSQKLSQDELGQVKRAYDLALVAHRGQVRDEGAPYIIHPVRVAASLVQEVGIYSPQLVCAALMHDVIEDSPITRMEIETKFGAEVGEVVWLLTKFEEVTLADYLDAIEAAASTGAPLVKLCDRLDNLRYLAGSPSRQKKYRYIGTTETYYLPMAQRTNRYLHDELELALSQVRADVESSR